jgi:hypothetical protein
MPSDRGAAQRDAGLHRVSRLTRWLLAGALALTAAFSAIAARALPGQAANHASTTASTDQSSRTDTSSSDQSAGDSALQPPTSSPSASGGSGSVTSGGS